MGNDCNRDWTPAQDGPIFCSPACGGKCTKEDWRKAWATAIRIAKTMGDGWRPDVWENLGWHARALDASGRWKIHPNAKGYTAYLGASDAGGRWVESGRTPKAAVAAVVRRAKRDMAEIVELLGESAAGK